MDGSTDEDKFHMKRMIFLVSGGGGNLKFFHQAMLAGHMRKIHIIVAADRHCVATTYAKKSGLDTHVINYSRNSPKELQEILFANRPDVVVTNWHKIIDAETVRSNMGKLVNLHYSLLPAFGGLVGIQPVKMAYEQGCKFIGPTCHLVDEGVDTGQILSQAVFTTERPIDDAITMMFRLGCLTLVSGIQIVLKDRLINNAGSVSERFSPDLDFDSSIFNEEFWKKVSFV